MRHKIVLYNPHAVFFDFPLGLLAVGSALDQTRYEVCIIDARVDPDPHTRLVREAKGALAVGVTALSGAPLDDALAATRSVKAQHPDVPVVWGGWHPSLFPNETLDQEASIDYCVYGQGEVTFAALVDTLASKGSVATIHGISYRDASGKAKKTAPRVLHDQDSLPKIDYGLIDPEKYFAAKGQRQLDYISSTGCFFRCTFCADPFVFKRKWTAISPERIVTEIAEFHAAHAITDVNFQDETFFTYRDRSIAIAEGLIEADMGIGWAATMRADQGNRMSDDDFALLKKSGLRRLLIGVESGSQAMMDWLKKDIKIEHVLLCADRCQRHGIAAIFPFIVGFPDETDESVAASMEMVKTLRSKSPEFQTPIFYFKPYPGTDITAEAERNGYVMPNTLEDWANFDYVSGGGGPWVSPDKLQLIERFKFYSEMATGRPSLAKGALQALSKLRCKYDYYGLPVEKALVQKIRRRPALS